MRISLWFSTLWSHLPGAPWLEVLDGARWQDRQGWALAFLLFSGQEVPLPSSSYLFSFYDSWQLPLAFGGLNTALGH